MAIALRHQYVAESELANQVNPVSYPMALKSKYDLDRRVAVAEPHEQRDDIGAGATTTRQSSPRELPGEIKPLWIGNPDAPARQMYVHPLQEWEGYVADVFEETFTARLVDRTAGQIVEEEIAEFPISELSDDDKLLLRSGAVFRWVIGYQRLVGGQKSRVSNLVFRRMPSWSKRDLVNASRQAEELINEINWE